MTVQRAGSRDDTAIFTGAAGDTKPTVASHGIIAGKAEFWETDTDNVYKWDGNSWVQTGTSGAAHVLPGSAGGSTAVTTLESFLIAGGASQTGTSVALPSGRVTFQAVANGSSGAFAATVTISVSNDDTNFITLGIITLSGTATTADVDGFASDAPWAYVRADVSGFSGTGGTCTVTMGI